MNKPDPILLADLADDDAGENGLGDGRGDGLRGDDNDDEAASASPNDDSDSDGAAATITLPPPEASDLHGLPLDELLKQLAKAAKPIRSGPRAGRVQYTPGPAERQSRLARITSKLADTELLLAGLEAQRGSVDVLDDEELAAFHRDLATVQATVTTLRSAHELQTEQHARAEAAEARRSYENWVRATVASHADKYAAGLQELHFYQAQIAALGPALEDHREAIEGASFDAVSRDRADLALEPEIIRRAVCRLYEGEAAAKGAVLPKRYGETDAQWHSRLFATLAARANGRVDSNGPTGRQAVQRAKQLYLEPQDGEDEDAYGVRQLAHLAEHLPCRQAEAESDDEHAERLLEMLARKLHLVRKGESDSAYSLRVANAHAMAAENAGDILDLTRQRAVPVLEAHCASPAAAEHARRVFQHARHVRELDPWAGGGKPMDYEMTKAAPPRRLPAPPPMPPWVHNVANFGDK